MTPKKTIRGGHWSTLLLAGVFSYKNMDERGGRAAA
jgi:hypothetical protein